MMLLNVETVKSVQSKFVMLIGNLRLSNGSDVGKNSNKQEGQIGPILLLWAHVSSWQVMNTRSGLSYNLLKILLQ